jgi:hypothetical protein
VKLLHLSGTRAFYISCCEAVHLSGWVGSLSSCRQDLSDVVGLCKAARHTGKLVAGSCYMYVRVRSAPPRLRLASAQVQAT